MFWFILFLIIFFAAEFPILFVGALEVLYWAIIFFGSGFVPIIIVLIILPELYKLFFRWEKYYGNETYDRGGRNALRIVLSLALMLGIALTAVLWSKFPEMAEHLF